MNVSPTLPAAPLFAHQGGWDEIMLVAVPLALIGLALWLANRRVAAQLGNDHSKKDPDSPAKTDTDT